MLGAGIKDLLANDPGLWALIAGRVSAVKLPDNPVLPAIAFFKVYQSRRETLDTSGMQKVNMQFDVYGTSELAAETVCEALRLLLDGYGGTLSDGTVLQLASLKTASDAFAQDSRAYRCIAEYDLLFCYPAAG